MDFGSYKNWRSAPRQTMRHQQTRNYSTVVPKKATGDRDAFGELLSKSPDIYAGAAVASLNQMLYGQRTIVSNKKFNMPFDSSNSDNMQIVKSKNILNHNTSRPTKTTNSFMRNSRVDFYPVFVGMSNFFSGIVNNLTGAGREETAIDASANTNVADSPPIVHSMCDLVRAVDSDISGNGAKNTAGECRTAAAGMGSCSHGAGMDAEADRSPAAAARGCQAKVNSIKELLNKSKVLASKPSIEVTAVEDSVDVAVEDSVDVVDCGPVTNASVISSCEDKLQKLKQTILSLKKTKINARSPTPDSPKFSQNSLKPFKFTSKEGQIPTEPSCKKQCKSDAIQIPVNRRNKTRGRADKSRKRIMLDADLALPQESEYMSLSSSTEAPRKCEPKPEPKPGKSILKKSSLRMAETPSSESDCEFNEVKGRFNGSRSSECESDDSFVIIFQDPNEPEPTRQRIPSECESEDSFVICFEPEPCYTNEVFLDSDSDQSDSESENEDVVTQSIGDLTDSLCRHSVSNMSVQSAGNSNEVCAVVADSSIGSSVEQPIKKVRFASKAPLVHLMCTWSFAHRAARVGPWERAANDRERFKRRIADADMALSWVLKPQHRARVLFQRIMPWRHAQRRLELAEIKRNKDEEERIRKENEEKDRIQREKEEVERIQRERSIQRDQEKPKEDLHCNGNPKDESVESLNVGDGFNSCDNKDASDSLNSSVNQHHCIISDSNFSNIINVPVRNHSDPYVNNFNTDLTNTNEKIDPSFSTNMINGIDTNCIPPVPKNCNFNIVNTDVNGLIHPVTNSSAIINANIDDLKCYHNNESEHYTKINVPKEMPAIAKNGFININGNHPRLDLNNISSSGSLAENLTLLNDALISADSAISELDRLAQQTIKYIDINVNRAVGELANCYSGSSGSITQVPLHNKSNGSRTTSNGDLVANNITMIR